MISRTNHTILLTIILLLLSSYTVIAVERDTGMRDLIREVHELIRTNKEAGRDVSQAMELDNKAKRLMKSGNETEAKKVLSEAVSLLNLAKASDAAVTPKSPVLRPLEESKQTVSSDFIYGIMVAPAEASAMDKMETYFEICKDLGIPYLKIGILWDLVEPVDGRFVWKSDSSSGLTDKLPIRPDRKRGKVPSGREDRAFDYDYIASLSQKYNVSVILTFLRSRMPEKELNAEKYAAFVYAFVNRYKKSMNIKYIEFQNEPNSGNDGSGNGRHWTGTAEDLARVNSAAYDKIKSAYPDIMIGTAGFISGSKTMIDKYTTTFYEKYFKANPKFDVFMLHEYPKNMNYTQATIAGDLSSQFHVFESYRNLLKNYGYGDKPILVSEGYEDKPFKNYLKPSTSWMDEEEASTLVTESYVFTLINAKKHNVIGKTISGVRTGSNQTIGLVDAVSGNKRPQYYTVKNLIALFKKYPIYSRHVAGEINSDDFWIEEFTNSAGRKLWIAFNPITYTTDDELLPSITSKAMKYPQSVKLNVGKVAEVQILRIQNGNVDTENIKPVNGEISFNLEKSPLFIYDKIAQ